MTDGLAKRWYWVAEAAEICGVSPKTIYSWIESGKIRTVLKAAPYRIPREELNRLLSVPLAE